MAWAMTRELVMTRMRFNAMNSASWKVVVPPSIMTTSPSRSSSAAARAMARLASVSCSIRLAKAGGPICKAPGPASRMPPQVRSTWPVCSSSTKARRIVAGDAAKRSQASWSDSSGSSCRSWRICLRRRRRFIGKPRMDTKEHECPGPMNRSRSTEHSSSSIRVHRCSFVVEVCI